MRRTSVWQITWCLLLKSAPRTLRNPHIGTSLLLRPTGSNNTRFSYTITMLRYHLTRVARNNITHTSAATREVKIPQLTPVSGELAFVFSHDSPAGRLLRLARCGDGHQRRGYSSPYFQHAGTRHLRQAAEPSLTRPHPHPRTHPRAQNSRHQERRHSGSLRKAASPLSTRTKSTSPHHTTYHQHIQN